MIFINSLLTAIGLGTLVNDKYLAPALVAGIAITSAASAFTYQRHHNPIPLLLTVASGTWIYYYTYSHYQKPRVWIGLAALVATQLYDAYRTTRSCQIREGPGTT